MPDEPSDGVLEELREFLADALRTQATMCAHSASHLRELGDGEAALGETGCALLAAFLADDVRGWTHTTRLREGLAKFEPGAAAAALALIVDDEDLEVVEVAVTKP